MTFREKYNAMQRDVRPDAPLLQRTRGAESPRTPEAAAPADRARGRACLPCAHRARLRHAGARRRPRRLRAAVQHLPRRRAVLQARQPKQRDNGIRLTVDSVYLHSDTVEIYVSLQDLTGDRLDETTDLFDSYRINRAFDCSATCSLAGYDAQTRTARFLISITSFDGQDIEGDKLTFSLNRLLTGKTESEGAVTGLDLAAAQAEPATAGGMAGQRRLFG